MGAAVAVLLIKERHIVEAFRRAGATTAEKAVVPEDINVGTHGAAWGVLHNRAIMRSTADGRYYLDELSWEASRRLRQQRLLIVVMLVAAFAIWYIGPWRR
jgi:hypothetical protein